MFRGTTPTLVFEVDKDFSLQDLRQVWVTIENRSYEKTYDINMIEIDPVENTISVRMSQDDTLAFQTDKLLTDKCHAQIRFLDRSGQAYATDEVEIELKRILKEGVIR